MEMRMGMKMGMEMVREMGGIGEVGVTPLP